MTHISLRPGEALCIDSGGLRMLVRPEGHGWQIRLVKPWWKRWLRAWQEYREVRLLAELDEHILRDIGMDAGSSEPLAARAQAVREHEQRRLAIAQLGLM